MLYTVYLFQQRSLFRHYYKGTEAVVIVVDSHDKERLDELYYDVIKPCLASEELSNACFLFLANKCDIEPHMSIDEISDHLSLRTIKHTWSKYQDLIVYKVHGFTMNERVFYFPFTAVLGYIRTATSKGIT